jgi:hydroxymethylpyrimidine pyrophosphatase-like HAD family hydrolase
VRFRVLACDYDRTIATHGEVSREVVDALRRVAASGRRLLLVTGRILSELEEVFADLPLFDRIVVENGGLLLDPATGVQRLLGPPIPADLVAELRDAGVAPLVVGRVMCGTLEVDREAVRAALHRLGVEREMIRNKESLMVLPTGVDKASGLRAALDELGEELARTVAVGDAENDVVMVRAAGCGVAVANGVDELKAQAGLVLDHPNGEGVRRLCDALAADDLAELLRQAAGTAAG